MCQSVAEGGRRCPSHRYDTRAVLKTIQTREGGYGSSIYHAAFLDLRRTFRGQDLEDSSVNLQNRVETELADAGSSPIQDTHHVDPATLLAQHHLLMSEHGVINQQTDAYICALINADTDETSRRIFSYLYDNIDNERDVTDAEKRLMKEDLLASNNSYLAHDEKALKTLALLNRGRFHVLSEQAILDQSSDPLPRITTLKNVASRHSPVAVVGFDPSSPVNNSRLEMVLRNDLDTVLVYQNVTEAQYEAIVRGGQEAADAVEDIRLNPDCRYDSPEDAHNASTTSSTDPFNSQTHCQNCGQFVGATPHACPALRLPSYLYEAVGRQQTPSEPEHGKVVITTPQEELQSETPEDTPLPPAFLSERVLPQTPEEQVYPAPGTLIRGIDYRHINIPNGAFVTHIPVRLAEHDVREVLVDQALFSTLNETFRPENRATVLYTASNGVTIYRLDEEDSPEVVITQGDRFCLRARGRQLAEGQSWQDEYGIIPSDSTVIPENHTMSSRLAPVPSTYRLLKPQIWSTGESRVDDPQRGEGDKWSFGSAPRLVNALNDGETVVVPFHHSFGGGWNSGQSAFVDAQGWEVQPGRQFTTTSTVTSGKVALRKNAQGVVEVVGVESLHCSNCSNSNCTHLGYSVRQTPYIAQEAIRQRDTTNSSRVRRTSRREPNPVTGLPVSLENRCVVTRDPSTGHRTISFEDGRTAMYEWGRGRLSVDNTSIVTEEGDERVIPELFRIETRAPNPTLVVRAIRNVSSEEKVVVPVIASFQAMNRGLGVYNIALRDGYVEGTITYGKDASGNTIVRERTLRCNCDVYARNYSCRHTRRVEMSETTLIVTAPPIYQPSYDQDTENLSTIASSIAVQDRELAAGREISFEEARTIALREFSESPQGQQQVRLAAEAEAVRQRTLLVESGYSTQRAKMAERYANPDGPNYSEDYAAFEAKVAEINAKIATGGDPLPYRTVNVLNGIGDDNPSARKFGVELEVVFPSSDQSEELAEALYDAGFAQSGEVGEYHTGQENNWNGWSVELDDTVDLEIVSPLLKDTPEDWEQLNQVINIIKAHGGEVNHQTGSHVHISTGDYGRSVATHAALVQTVARNADFLYRLGSNPETKRHRGVDWCLPNVITPGTQMNPEGLRDTGWGQMGSYLNASHTKALNLEASGQGITSHAEVRIWDGSLSPAHIQMQVMLTAAMAEKAAQDTITGDDSSTFTFLESNEPQYPLGDAKGISYASKQEETKGFRDFITEMFPRQEDRDVAITAFVMGKWQEKRRNEW